MSTLKRIVCLANSRKYMGRCVAGKELVGNTVGPWIRPVSVRPHEEVSCKERSYPDGSDPDVLDIIDVSLLRPRSRSHHSENWLLDPTTRWARAGRMSWSTVGALADHPAGLWLNTWSSYVGLHDR